MGEDNVSMAAFIESAGLIMTAVHVANRPGQMGEDSTMDHWLCTFTSTKARGDMVVHFSMGSGHHGKAPKLGEVLDCVASDAAGIENADGFEDWAAEYGYDTDSRKAEKTYNECAKEAARLLTFLGESAYKTLLWNTDRE